MAFAEVERDVKTLIAEAIEQARINAIHKQLNEKYNLLSEVQKQEEIQTYETNINKLFYDDLYTELERIQQNERNPTISQHLARKIELKLMTRIAMFDYIYKKYEMRDVSHTTYFKRIRAFLLREKKVSLFSCMKKVEIIQLVDDVFARITNDEIANIVDYFWIYRNNNTKIRYPSVVPSYIFM